ncbi:oxygenase MpaB family protein [Sphingobium sp. H39-3-25]|uniref:oxygenase MpaB family protein n=1 Tax=Sphingobium arseniciresistens TaxID=3030834 RepID=UPI0023B98419|nr:oxygenase MpaB family protein [Sphingobium arseniciresistens]
MSNKALFDRNSIVWRVHGDVGAMMVGGIASLLMQMLHPSVLAGVWDHSNFRSDMHGRLRRTARFIAMTTYAERTLGLKLIAHVRSIHEGVKGVLPDGTPYRANDPSLLAWVHLTETRNFLAAWVRYADPMMRGDEQDRYFAEMAMIGQALGADPVPRSRREARALIEAMRPALRTDARTAEIAKLILGSRGIGMPNDMPRRLAVEAAIDLLPGWARTLHGLGMSPLERPIIRAGTWGVAQTLRWAFR